MATETTRSPMRERFREQVREDVKTAALDQLAAGGAQAISINAIAKQLGVSGPALYRYFASRDELLTELIRDAYRSLADTLQAAAAGGAELAGLAHAARDWALEAPQRYFLVYGTPVPGYHAPADTSAIASEIMVTLLDACRPVTTDTAKTDFDEHLEGHPLLDSGNATSATTLHRALSFWTRLHGALSLELAGHFTGMGFDPARLFDAEMDSLQTP